ncbi:hypothetical protein PAHAL_6G128800 [Panicum hallii]|uniref:Uncharacterized protein n=1 Tax=Panicum hallii TaxID=206008 RepID=A0A2T8IG43_9POAL|nr:hypothetical protein PAHAL_6G128800 [Panicum hallii]
MRERNCIVDSYQLAALLRAGVLDAHERHRHGHSHNQAQEGTE